MVVSLEQRKQYFQDLAKKPPEQKKTIFYKGERKLLPIHDVNMDYVVFNQHNGRLESKMQTWMAECGSDHLDYDQEVNDKIKNFLWDDHPSKNMGTLSDLRRKGQLEPGIITSDGVIIDGNRRAMILQRMDINFIKCVLLPDFYDENEKEIVKLETQYQIGEDPKLAYGPIEKYLHAKRLSKLGIENAPELMRRTNNDFNQLIEIMKLMDNYLEDLNCPGLYNLLIDNGGTKEGMFVDLHADLKKLEGQSSALATWDYDETDVSLLQAIQFDMIRYGEVTGTEKQYRKISHSGTERKDCFFAHQDIWDSFAKHHEDNVPSSRDSSLEAFIDKNNQTYATRESAAKAWTKEWIEQVGPKIKENLGQSKDKLESKTDETEPNRLLKRALNALEAIDIENTSKIKANLENTDLIKQINTIGWDLKKISEK